MFKACRTYGKDLPSFQDILSSLNLTIRGIMSRLKQKYSVDTSDENSAPYVQLMYLKEINPKFTELQQQYELFTRDFFN